MKLSRSNVTEMAKARRIERSPIARLHAVRKDQTAEDHAAELLWAKLSASEQKLHEALRELSALRRALSARAADDLDLRRNVRRLEVGLITDALRRSHGNQTRAAQLLGLKLTTLNAKIKRYGIDPEEFG